MADYISPEARAYLDKGGTLSNGQIPAPVIDPTLAIRQGQAGTAASRVQSGGMANTSPVITVDSLGNTKPLTAPPAPYPTSSSSAVATGQSKIDGFPKDGGGDDLMTRLEAMFPEAPAANSAGDYKAAQQDPDYLAKVQAEQQAKSAQRAAEAELQGYSNQIQGLMNEREVLKQEAEKNIPAGVPREILNRQQMQIERDTASKILPVQMQALIAQSKVANLRGNTELASEALSSAKEQMNTYFTLQQKDAEANYKRKLDVFNAVKDLYSDYRAEELDAKKTKDAQNFQRETIFRQDIGVAVGKAIESGQASVAEAMRLIDPNSPTAREELARLEGQIKKSATDITATAGSVEEFRLLNGRMPNSIAELNQFTASRSAAGREPKAGGAGSGLNTGSFEFGTPEYVSAAIESSSQYDKRLLADERKNITSAKRAIGSLELYQQAINGTLDKKVSTEVFGEGTGVIKGRLRTLAGVWGGDPNAAAVNAIIQGIIPTIARGIFQEVGVLTDADIANYKKVVPDINKPENANKLIELVLLKTLERTYADTLLTAAQNQTNVSNFKDEYNDVIKRIQVLTGETSPKTPLKSGSSGTTSGGLKYTIE